MLTWEKMSQFDETVHCVLENFKNLNSSLRERERESDDEVLVAHWSEKLLKKHKNMKNKQLEER